MKKIYKIMIGVIVAELCAFSVGNKIGLTSPDSWLGNAIGTFVSFLPIQILFFLLSRDNNLSERKRLCFKIVFGFILMCYVLGAIATLVECLNTNGRVL